MPRLCVGLEDLTAYRKTLSLGLGPGQENPHVYYPWDTGTGDVDAPWAVKAPE